MNATVTGRDRRFCVWLAAGGAGLVALGAAVAHAVGGAIHPTAFALAHPDSFLDFAPAVLVPVGVAATIAGVLGARVADARSVRRVAAVGGTLLVLVVVSSAVLTVVRRTTVTASDGRLAALLRAQNTRFVPDELDASGRSGRIVVRNSDPYAHTFTVEALGVDEYIGPGSDRLVDLPASKSATFEFICRVTGHDAMRGTLVVR